MSSFFTWLLHGIATLLVWFFNAVSAFGSNILNTLLSGAAPFVSPSALHQMDSVLRSVNFFFPLTESVGFATSLFGVWLVCLTYRAVKSWIPFLSGS